MKIFPVLRAGLALLAATVLAGAVHAQTYPEKPVRMIVGLQAGASTDALARALARRLSERLGQQFVVENKPGAGTRIAMEQVMRSPADGYTLGLANAVAASFPLMFDNFHFVPGKDFTPITMLGRAPSYLAVRSTLPVKNVEEFVAYAKANSGKISYGQGSTGSNPHLAALTLVRSLGIEAVEAVYKGNAPTALAVAAGEVDFAILDYPSVRPMVESGRVRLLAVTEPQRAAQTPDVPTSGEQGLTRDLDGVTVWFMLVAPPGTPAAVVDLLNRHVNDILRQPDMQQSLAAAGIQAEGSTPAEAAAYFLKQRERVTKAVRDFGISLRN